MSEKKLKTKRPMRAGTAWLLVGISACAFAPFLLASRYTWPVWEPLAALKYLSLTMTGLFVSLVCFAFCSWQRWLAKGILMCLLGASTFVVGQACDMQFRQHSSVDSCTGSLKQIAGAKSRWALEKHKTTNDVPVAAELFGKDRYLDHEPTCLNGGVYSIGRVGVKPQCSFAGHSLE